MVKERGFTCTMCVLLSCFTGETGMGVDEGRGIWDPRSLTRKGDYYAVRQKGAKNPRSRRRTVSSEWVRWI